MNAPTPAWNRNFRRRSGDEPSVVAELPHRRGVAIGSRWTPKHVVHRDPDAGVFFERNPPMGSEAEKVQAALLSKPSGNGWGWWAAGWALPFAAYLFARWMWP